MKKKLVVLLTTIAIVFVSSISVMACDEVQTKTYTTQILFNRNKERYKTSNETQMLMAALYLCSEQSGEKGKTELKYLDDEGVHNLPELKDIKVTQRELQKCSHNTWEYQYLSKKEQQKNRKAILTDTVNKVFDFGFWNKHFGKTEEKSNSFAALLYYSHILCDYLADNPQDTEAQIKNNDIPAFSGEPYVELNGNRPQFSVLEKHSKKSFIKLSALDELGRTGMAFANIGVDDMPEPKSRQSIGNIKPSGWNQEKYNGIVNSQPGYIYNRCHLIAHQLIGNDTRLNLITGSRYLNEAMIPWENQVSEYITKTKNHVLYRAIPVYKGDNLLASGVQLEAYSIEDRGKGVSFNIYLYNVQPGIEFNYMNGENELSDSTFEAKGILPFARMGANEKNSDLMLEMRKHLEILFEDQKNTRRYSSMMNELKVIEKDARNVGNVGENRGKQYIELNQYKHRYYKTLKEYVPNLLKKEKFFKSAFK